MCTECLAEGINTLEMIKRHAMVPLPNHPGDPPEVPHNEPEPKEDRWIYKIEQRPSRDEATVMINELVGQKWEVVDIQGYAGSPGYILVVFKKRASIVAKEKEEESKLDAQEKSLIQREKSLVLTEKLLTERNKTLEEKEQRLILLEEKLRKIHAGMVNEGVYISPEMKEKIGPLMK